MKRQLLCAIPFIFAFGCTAENQSESSVQQAAQPPEEFVIQGSEADSWNPAPLTSCWLSDPKEVAAYVKLTRINDEGLEFTCGNGKTHTKLESDFVVDELHWLNENETTEPPAHVFGILNTYVVKAGNPLSPLKKEALITLRQASDGKWYVTRWLEVSSATSSVELEQVYQDNQFPTSWSTLVDEVTSQQADFSSLCGASNAIADEDFEAMLFEAWPGHCNLPEPPPEPNDDGDDNN